MTEQYHQIELKLGMWPGFFSGDGPYFLWPSGGPYFRNATWYNRDRPLFQRYVPVLHEINFAGWQPITAAVMSTATPPAWSCVWVGRFGPGDDGGGDSVGNGDGDGDDDGNGNGTFVYFTIRNEGHPDLAQSLTWTLDGTALGLEEARRHATWEMTRRSGVHFVNTTRVGSLVSMEVVMGKSPVLGVVAINETVALKLETKTQIPA